MARVSASGKRRFRKRPPGLEALERRDLATGGLPTTVELSSSTAYPYAGESLTLTAAISGSGGTAAPGGVVTFFEDSVPIAMAAVSGSTAQLTITLGPGAHNLNAAYSGDAQYGPAYSPELPETVISDVTTLSHITALRLRRYNQRYVTSFLVRNDAGFAFPGPVEFALANLSPRVTVRNLQGVTGAESSTGVPYLTVTQGALAPGASVKLTLVLHSRTRQFSFTPRIIAGV